jgi:SpoIID/LytB domain protein
MSLMPVLRSLQTAAVVSVLAVSSLPMVAAAAPGPPRPAPAARPLVQGYGPTVTLTGHGFGHGIGMSQVGAYGYAVHFGWTAEQILAHYYGGTTLGTANPAQPLTVRLLAADDDPVTAVIQDSGSIATSATGAEQYRSVAAVRVAPGSYTLYVRSDAVNCPTGTTTADFDAAGSPWVKKAEGLPSVDFTAAGVDPAGPAASLLGLCERPATDQLDGSVAARSYRGSIRAVTGSAGEARTVNVVPVDLYVQGVVPREMPASWGSAGGGAGLNALRAQAVAARSYGLAQGRYTYAQTCDTQSCQVYGGAGVRTAVNPEDGGPLPVTAIESPFANQATADTAGVVLMAGGTIVSALYSASSGGYTNDAGPFPAVPDDGDQYSPLPDRHDWATTLSVATIEATFPQIGSLQTLKVAARNGLGQDGGRVRSLLVIGTVGTVALTGTQFQSQFGLRSDWFTVPPGCDGRILPPVAPPVPAVAAKFEPVVPARLLDTRDGTGTSVGAIALAADCTQPLQVVGVGGVPGTGVSAVAVNVTATQAETPGFLTVYPCGQNRPDTSTVNYSPGQNVANMAQVQVGTNGQICIYTLSKVHVVVDVLGWYGDQATAGYSPVPPVRALDTRYGIGIGGQRRAASSGSEVTFNPVAEGLVPPEAAGLMLNLTDTEAGADGFLTAYGCGSAVPLASNLNYRAGRDVANQAIAGLGAGGQACVTSFATSQVVADVVGWFGPTATGLFVPLPPSRILDSRQPNSVFTGKVPAGGIVVLPVQGVGGLPASGMTAAELNVTVDQPSGSGYLTAYPCSGPSSPPVASTLNYVAGQVAANLTTVAVGGGNTAVCLYSYAAADLVVDVGGYYR